MNTDEQLGESSQQDNKTRKRSQPNASKQQLDKLDEFFLNNNESQMDKHEFRFQFLLCVMQLNQIGPARHSDEEWKKRWSARRYSHRIRGKLDGSNPTQWQQQSQNTVLHEQNMEFLSSQAVNLPQETQCSETSDVIGIQRIDKLSQSSKAIQQPRCLSKLSYPKAPKPLKISDPVGFCEKRSLSLTDFVNPENVSLHPPEELLKSYDTPGFAMDFSNIPKLSDSSDEHSLEKLFQTPEKTFQSPEKLFQSPEKLFKTSKKLFQSSETVDFYQEIKLSETEAVDYPMPSKMPRLSETVDLQPPEKLLATPPMAKIDEPGSSQSLEICESRREESLAEARSAFYAAVGNLFNLEMQSMHNDMRRNHESILEKLDSLLLQSPLRPVKK